jgi:glycosyltransferase involved in cell wall biosynthesis
MEAAGVQTLLMNLYRSIDRSKLQFDFLVHYTQPQFFDDEIEKLGGKIYRLSFREDFNVLKYCRDLNDFFSTHKEYYIVHAHMHSLGAVYLHYAKKHGVPIRIAHSHTNAVQNDSKKWIKQIMNRLYKKDATDLFACSSLAGQYMFGGDKFTVINNAIITDNFIFSQGKRDKKRKELGIDDRIVLGNIGRLEIQKNQMFLLDVFAQFYKKHPNSVLLCIGSGSMLDELKVKVKTLKLDNVVKFLGNRRDIAEILMAMDVFVFPSLFEGLGIVGVEAQAAGTPVVCTDTLPEEISVSPLLHRITLNASIDEWVSMIEVALADPNAHNDMKENIVSANYDMQ